jgi:hypothetical protein
LDREMRIAAVGHLCGVSKINYLFHKEKWRWSQEKPVSTECEIFCVSWRGPFLKKVERALCVCLEDEVQKGLTVSGAVVMGKNMHLYHH